jgi:ribosomal protein L24
VGRTSSIVEGVNRVYKHLKPSRNNPQGGRLSKEMPIDASNVALVDPTTNQPTRVGVKYQDDGSKVLVAKKSGTVLRTLSKPNRTTRRSRNSSSTLLDRGGVHLRTPEVTHSPPNR